MLFRCFFIAILGFFGTSKNVFGQTNFRLVDGTNDSNGRVEVFYNGTWGTVCDDGWNTENTLVVCKLLNFVSGYKIQTYPGTGPIWLDDVKCVGNESSLVECNHAPWGSNNCAHIEDVSLQCNKEISTSTEKSSLESQINVQLAGGDGRSYGRVEIYYRGEWGTICDDQWDNNDARVICHMLGYNDGVAFAGGQYGPGTGPIWVDDAECIGNEISIAQCPRNSWGDNNCRHIEDAGVECRTSQQAGSSVSQQPLTWTRDLTESLTTQPVTTATATPLSIRLMGGNNRNNGRVEILYQGKWGTVCDDQWDDSDGQVICRMLGYSGGTAQGNARYGLGTGKIWLDEVSCLGNETSIDQCNKNKWGQHNCGHAEDASVDCNFTASLTTAPPLNNTTAITTPVTVQLVGGNGRNNGRVEILYQGQWGTVCDDRWDDNEANVICRMLGYSGGTAHGNARYGAGTGKIWLDEVSCLGNETSIDQCIKDKWGQHNCGHAEDAGVDCHFTTQQPLSSTKDFTTQKPLSSTRAITTPVTVQLVGGNGRNNGRVEILYQGQWGTVCDDRWDDNEANVICRMLGYSGGTAQGNANYGSGMGIIWLDEVNCLGNETSIDQCKKNEWGEHNCVHSEDAGVNCTISITQISTTPRVDTTQQTESTRVSTTPSTSMHDSVIIQLAGSIDSSAGRVEIFYQGQWGTVCDDQWDNNDARVICRMLGFSDGISTVGGSYGPGNGSIWLDEVKCSGNEQSITECTSNPWGSTDCKHSEDAGVKCGITSTTPSNPLLAIRLVGGNTTSSGRVEINYNNKWGTVCHDKWDDNDARVVCRMLGYNHGIAFNAAKYGMGSGDIWLDEVNCTGSENSIADCPKNSWGVHDCHHGEDAGVDCSTNAIPVSVRLVGGDNASSGRVELNLNGEWGTICDDGWDNADALVICRMLGYVDGIGLSFGWYGAGIGKIFLDDVNCLGNETSIIHCQKQAWESSNCDHGEDASVQCFSQKATTVTPSIGSDVSVRLAGVNSLSRGRVEIRYSGQWGTICDDSWDDRDAQVVCKMLGYVDGSASGTFQAGTGPIWLDQVECQGSEVSILQCVRNRWGIHDCSHSEDAGVECSMTIIRTTSLLTGNFTTTPSNRGAQGIQQARLVGGNDFTVGRLEVMINNVWGTVCDDNWDDRDATVACRMLGFSSGIGYRNAKFGSGTGQIWLDELNCTGAEISLSQCASSNAGVHDCSHLEDASVQCFTKETTAPTMGTASIRLNGGQNTNEGRVEIYHQGQWGSICNNNWDMKEIIVACRMLGFKEGDIHNRTIPGIGIIWLSNVDCNGSEISLEQCSKSDWGVHDCQHSQDVAIICQ